MPKPLLPCCMHTPTGGYASLADAVDAWYNEVKLYDFSKPGWNTATGHFTALVWKSTSKLGCAVNTACGMATYVCQYQAPGNAIGVDWSAQVKPAMSSAPASPTPTPKSSPAPIKPSSSPAILPKRSSRRSPAPVLTASPAPVAVVSPKTADMQQVLDLHNTFRTVHQVGVSLLLLAGYYPSLRTTQSTAVSKLQRTSGSSAELSLCQLVSSQSVTGAWLAPGCTKHCAVVAMSRHRGVNPPVNRNSKGG